MGWGLGRGLAHPEENKMNFNLIFLKICCSGCDTLLEDLQGTCDTLLAPADQPLAVFERHSDRSPIYRYHWPLTFRRLAQRYILTLSRSSSKVKVVDRSVRRCDFSSITTSVSDCPLFVDINISSGSLATRIGYGRNISTANLPLSMPVKRIVNLVG